MSKSERKSVLPAEPSHGYEFGGPIVVFAASLGLPILCYLPAFLCNDISGCPIPSALHPRGLTLNKLKEEVGWSADGILGLASFRVTGWVLAYYLFSLVLYTVLPGQEVEGPELRSGGKLKYKFNAFQSALLTLGLTAAGTVLQGPEFAVWTFIWDNYVQIVTANLGIALALAWLFYYRSFDVTAGNTQKRELAEGGHSGNLVYDWFIGRELNPRVELPIFGIIDIKAFCELRPGMLGWILLDLAYIAHQYKLHGSISDSILLITGFQTLYVLDAVYMEPAIMTTIDITTDGFGFMLAFGDLVWLPFIYSLQARYLAVYPVHLGIWGIIGVLTPQALGYYIFRGANNEKNRFRNNPKDPKVAHLQSIKTAKGTRLLTSGWWGTARHINYLGDWIMAWSYCLPTGMAGYQVLHSSLATNNDMSPANGGFTAGAPVKTEIVQGEAKGWGMLFTYFYILYFAILLVHREMRDEAKCSRKYCADWEEYKKKVPWRILPGVY